MSTPALVDLVCHLYEATYGKIGSKILNVLLNKGRCTAVELTKLTELPYSAVQRTLVSLITNRFVLFWKGPKTYYFGNWKQVYTILWTGEILNCKDEDEREVIQNTIIEGMVPGNSIKTPSKYLRTVAEWEFWSPDELTESLETRAKQEVSSDPDAFGKSEAAKKQLIAASTRNELARIRSTPQTGDVNLVIDWDKFLITARRSELAAYASRTVGEVSGRLYEIVLRLSEKSVNYVKEIRVPAVDTSVTTQQIVSELNEEFITELKQVFQQNSSSDEEIKEESSAKRVKLNAGNAKAAVVAGMSPAELVNKHLTLLSSVKSARFIQRIGGRQQGEWFVPFDRVVEDLQRAALDEIIAQSFGEPAARLIRLIRVTGKLDEKMLANQALLPALEIRHQMSALASYGFADIQELAKPNDRGGSAAAGAQKRSVFLWHHRPKWAHSRLLDLLYIQLQAVLRDQAKLRTDHCILLAKLTREDVLSDIDQYLTVKEREELELFRKAEHDLYKKMNMIDRTVRIFREY